MSIVWHRYIDVHLAEPSGSRRRELRPSAGSAPSPPGAPLRAAPGVISRWLRSYSSQGGRSQRGLSFGVRADTPSTRQTARAPMPFASLFLSDGADRDALNVARRSRALDALARTTAAVQAAHSIGEGAPNNGARGTFGGEA